MLLAIMNVLVFVLPLYQLWCDFREPFNNVYAKAAGSFRNAREKLSNRFGSRAPAAPAAEHPPEMDGSEQASSHACTATGGVPSLLPCACNVRWICSLATSRCLIHRPSP